MSLDSMIAPPSATAWETMNVLLYAGPGKGKTTGAMSAPGPILLVNAEGRNAVQYARSRFPEKRIDEVPVTATNVVDAMREVALHVNGGAGDHKTVVVDSLGELYAAMLENVAGSAAPTLPQYRDVGDRLLRFVRKLCHNPNVSVILLAHELAFRAEDGSMERVPFCGTNAPKMAMQIMKLVDVIAYGVVKVTEDGTRRYGATIATPVAGAHGKDRTDALGDAQLVNVEAWLGLAQAAGNVPGADTFNVEQKRAAKADS